MAQLREQCDQTATRKSTWTFHRKDGIAWRVSWSVNRPQSSSLLGHLLCCLCRPPSSLGAPLQAWRVIDPTGCSPIPSALNPFLIEPHVADGDTAPTFGPRVGHMDLPILSLHNTRVRVLETVVKVWLKVPHVGPCDAVIIGQADAEWMHFRVYKEGRPWFHTNTLTAVVVEDDGEGAAPEPQRLHGLVAVRERRPRWGRPGRAIVVALGPPHVVHLSASEEGRQAQRWLLARGPREADDRWLHKAGAPCGHVGLPGPRLSPVARCPQGAPLRWHVSRALWGVVHGEQPRAAVVAADRDILQEGAPLCEQDPVVTPVPPAVARLDCVHGRCRLVRPPLRCVHQQDSVHLVVPEPGRILKGPPRHDRSELRRAPRRAVAAEPGDHEGDGPTAFHAAEPST
mmetsp:Transcript_40718/g.96830  ORF Transcript_40718/g.96830 Transcript_40718/m.96830 type:complete len:399 (+) Transcript_40718:127-1323(+)